MAADDWTGAHLISAKPTDKQRFSEAGRMACVVSKLRGYKPSAKAQATHKGIVSAAMRMDK